MKVLTILGTRPEIIKLSQLIPLLDKLAGHKILHTGQNYTANLKDFFFNDLKLRPPDYSFESKSETTFEEIGKILVGTEKILRDFQPDRIVILGDTNSGLSAIVAKKMAIPVFHLEAGNRCFDDRVPEETNRRIIDSCSEVLMTHSKRSFEYLIREGYHPSRVFNVGNPIKEVLDANQKKIDSSKKLKELGLKKKKYFLATLHRAENTNDKSRLEKFVEAFNKITQEYDMPIIWSIHPRTKNKIDAFNLRAKINRNIKTLDAMNFFDFVSLEKNCLCLISDSGTAPEEGSIFELPNVILRDSIERPEVIETGGTIVAGSDPESILLCVRVALNRRPNWKIAEDYLVPNWSQKVANIILGYHKI